MCKNGPKSRIVFLKRVTVLLIHDVSIGVLTDFFCSSSYKSDRYAKWRERSKLAQTHLKSFNGRQGGILQSISGVSGASGGLKSQNFDFLTQKFKMAVFARFHFLKSKNPISGHN